ncbi:unnamed protein product [Lathyrus sativus]|nr:unnamed protein product [Lathyrus sativus]CAK8065855.1 unnamed protein product [Lathyrus sativus]
MSSETVVLKVKMSCSGCSGAVNRVLEKMEGVESFDIDMKEQKVTVKGNVKPQDVFDTVSKTGKKTEFWEEPENKSTETATEAESDNKPSDSEDAAIVTEAEPKNKSTETATIGVVEPDNKPSETATVAA